MDGTEKEEAWLFDRLRMGRIGGKCTVCHAMDIWAQLEELNMTKSLANKIRFEGKVVHFQEDRSCSKTSK